MLAENSTSKLARDIRALGVDPPRALVTLAEAEAAIDTEVNADRLGELEQLILGGGELDPKALAIRAADVASALVYQDRLHQIRESLAPIFERARRRILLSEADAIVISLRPPFDAARAQLEQATTTLGPLPDNEPPPPSKGPALALAWESRARATATLTATRRIVQRLADLGHGPRHVKVDASYFVAEVADIPALAYAEELRRSGWAALADRFTLRLNTPDQATALRAGAQTVSDEAEREARQAANAVERKRSEKEIQRWRRLATASNRSG